MTVVSMGPPQAEEILRSALSRGADEAVLLSDRKFGGADTWATAYTISLAIKKLGEVDLVLFGKQAIDGDTAQVGPGVAHFLDIPVLTYTKIVEVAGDTLRVTRVIEDGHELWDIDMPCALTVVREANQLRMPTLRNRTVAKQTEIPIWGFNALHPDEAKIGLAGSPTKVSAVFAPPGKLDREILSGEPADVVAELIRKLRERKVL